MTRKIVFIRKLLDLIFGCLFSWLFVVFSTVVLFKAEPSRFFVPCVIWIYVTAYIIRELAKNAITILFAHAIFLVPFYFLNIEVRYVILFAMISFVLFCKDYSYIRAGKILKPVGEAPWYIFLFCFVFFLYGVYMKSEQLKNASYIVLVLLVITYLINLYVDGLGKYLGAAKNVSDIPLKNIAKTNSLIVGLIMLFLVLAIVVVNSHDWSRLVDIIVNGLVSVIKLIGFGILFVFNIIKMLLMRLPVSEMRDMIGNELQESNYAAQGQAVYTLLRFLLVAVMAFFLLLLVIKFVRKLFVRHNRMSDIVEDVSVKKKEKAEREKRKGIFSALFSPEERARRMYRSHILEYRYDVKLKETKTCQDICRDIYSETGENVSELTEIYSEVRYGEKKADRNVIKKISSLITGSR
ncbi:MAG: hypothetical protein NC393_02710 [Clostridium sp.]|nr:hypothetical protein [Clostridium sp.]MCM1171017.1 hypothetical protein [Clostridium sp.]MCM1208375.1 hypothetical protein [Ruminococcus sp.]